MDSVAGSTLFTTLDVTSGYHKVKVKEEDIPKTAVVTKYGPFEYVQCICAFCLIYLDDTLSSAELLMKEK